MAAPAKLVELLDELIPSFAQESYRQEIADLLWMSTDPSRSHRYYNESITLHSADLGKMFGRIRTFTDINRSEYGGRYFEVQRFSNFTGDPELDYTNGYKPRPWMRAVLDGYLEANQGAEFRDGRGQLKSLPLAIRPTDSRGNRIKRWGGVTTHNLIPANVENLRTMSDRFRLMIQAKKQGQLPKNYETIYGKKIDQLQSHLKEINTLIRQYDHFKGLPIQYVQSNTGRLYGVGVNLQTCKRQTRQAALAGLYDYDIEACHFAMLTQMASRFGAKCPAIDHYVANRSKIRNEIAAHLDLDYEQVKKAFSAMAYGARQSLDELDAIPEIIGSEAAGRLYKLDSYRSIKSDIQFATTQILNSHPLVKQRFINAIGKELMVFKGQTRVHHTKVKPHTQMSHLLQGLEAAVLEIAARTFSNKIVLLQHDGFTTSEPIDVVLLERTVEEQTGYRLKFDEEQVTMPDPDFAAHFLSINTKLEKPEKVNVHAGLEVFWQSLLRTVGTGVGDLLPPYPQPLNVIETPF